ncbi:hypothetical protein [Cellulomonas uda]|uniref:hypothetical protein n=1 Tax=Cellulomonas uda TaxID=1714 RepID=UPI001ABB85DE|nr:hypothetical protein [Cellulomonas uda]
MVRRERPFERCVERLGAHLPSDGVQRFLAGVERVVGVAGVAGAGAEVVLWVAFDVDGFVDQLVESALVLVAGASVERCGVAEEGEVLLDDSLPGFEVGVDDVELLGEAFALALDLV